METTLYIVNKYGVWFNDDKQRTNKV